MVKQFGHKELLWEGIHFWFICKVVFNSEQQALQ